MDFKSTLSWESFDSCVLDTFKNLISDQDFTDVTLVCENDKQVDAHKVILSSASAFFKRIFVRNPHQKPMLYLKGFKIEEVRSLLEFIYLGQTEVDEGCINRFISMSIDLEINGIDENMFNNTEEEYKETSIDDNISSEKIAMNIKKSKEMMNNENDTEDPIAVADKASQDDPYCPIVRLPTPPPGNLFQISTSKEDSFLLEEIPEDKILHQEYNSAYEKRGSGSYPCNPCGKRFANRNAQNRHKRIIHEGLRYPCLECDYQGTQAHSLRHHIKKKHGS